MAYSAIAIVRTPMKTPQSPAGSGSPRGYREASRFLSIAPGHIRGQRPCPASIPRVAVSPALRFSGT